MNKAELVDAVKDAAGLGSRSEAERAVNAFTEVIVGAVSTGDKVSLPGFGSWSRTDRAARMGRNPRTGEPVHIPASKGVKFSAGAGFKSAVQEK